MKKIAFIINFMFIALVVAQAQQQDFRKTPPEPGPAPKIEIGDYEQFELDNGLKVLVVENDKLPRVTYQVFVDAPPLKEDEYAGAVSMAGQLLKTGTTNKTKAEIDEAVDFIGASLSTSASGVFGSSLTKHKDKLLELMADVLFNPTFPEDEFEKLKTQTLSNLTSSKDDPNAISNMVAQVLRYGKDHPYGELTTEATVENITIDQCKAYYNTYFKPNISYLIVIGDITLEEAKKDAEQYFSEWAKAEVPEPEFEQPDKPGEAKVAFVNKPGAVQSVIKVTYPVELEVSDPHYLSALVTNTIFGGYFRSRLNSNLREDKGYTYGVSSTLSPDEEVGYFNAGGSVRNEVTDSAIVEFLYEMKRLQEEKVPEDELNLVKNYRTGALARALEQPTTIARFALNTIRYNLPNDHYSTYLERLNAVTADDVMAMAKRYITPDNAHILVVGNKGEVAEKLERFDADGEIDFYDYYGREVEQSKTDMDENMTAQDVIDAYIEALGGKETLMAVEDVSMTMQTNLQGMSMETIVQRKAPNKFAMKMVMNGSPMQEQKFDGEAGMASQMGQSQKLEGEALESMEQQAIMFPELQYATDQSVKLTLNGIENIDGTDAYEVIVESPSGKTTEYFAVDSGLKIRTVETVENAGQSATITTDIGEYKEVSGIMFPHKLTITGAAPIPLNNEVVSIEVNKGIADSVFEVE
jgi:predicted Zn-dependent peptidase